MSVSYGVVNGILQTVRVWDVRVILAAPVTVTVLADEDCRVVDGPVGGAADDVRVVRRCPVDVVDDPKILRLVDRPDVPLAGGEQALPLLNPDPYPGDR